VRQPERRTKIVASIGPASWDEPVLRKVIAAGADVIRINLSHGEPAAQLALIERVRRVSAEEHRDIGVLVDLPGPKLRMAPFPDRGVPLVPGDRLTLTCGAPESGASIIGVDLDGLGLAVGDRQTLDVAWLRFPELTLERVAQTYEHLGPTTWRYSAGGFSAVLEVDEHGFVRRYGDDLWLADAGRSR